MKKIAFGMLFGAAAGVLDLIPMIMQKLPLETDLSAFCLWMVSGFLIATSAIKLHPLGKGILIPFCVLLPSAVLIGWKEPISLIPMAIMTLFLGAVLGLVLENSMKPEHFSEAVNSGHGAWKDKDHPELKRGSAAYVRKIRKGSKAGKARKG